MNGARFCRKLRRILLELNMSMSMHEFLNAIARHVKQIFALLQKGRDEKSYENGKRCGAEEIYVNVSKFRSFQLFKQKVNEIIASQRPLPAAPRFHRHDSSH